jgi:hypothetical protein
VIKHIFSLLLIANLAISAYAADQRYRACVGQIGINPGDANCPNTNALFHCGTSPAQIGNAICSVYTDRGVQRFASDVKKISDVGGGQCGISIFDVICHDIPSDSVVQWHYDNCMSGGNNQCASVRPNTRWFACGPVRNIALSYCTNDGLTGPYQVFMYFDVPGAQCGVSSYAAGCHVPAP